MVAVKLLENSKITVDNAFLTAKIVEWLSTY